MNKGAWVFVALAGLCSAPAWAQSSTALVSGSLGGAAPDGGSFHMTYSCTGYPTCSGAFTFTETDSGCSNSFTYNGVVTINGLDLSKPGTLAGTVSVSTDTNSTILGDGTCKYTVGAATGASTYTATWDGSKGTFVVSIDTDDGPAFEARGTFTSNVSTPPVFPLTVTADINPTTSTASAQVQPRAADVGKTASLFVFTHAPSNLVLGASPTKHVNDSPTVTALKEDSIVCVLAQVNSAGQLVAVSASTMQAYLTGVLTSQNQAVTLLNNVSTPKVAGAILYVGYGSSASAMLSSGVYETAVSVPGGGVQCTASFASAPAPTLPGALTGLWWNANESGWGVHFTQRGSVVFAAWYTYDATGKPKWYVNPNCPMNGTGTSGTCTGDVYEVSGPTFFGTTFNTTQVNAVKSGTMTLNFTDANNGSMTYTVAGVTRSNIPITREPVASGTTAAVVDYSDLWWNSSESGWGMVMAQQLGNVFLAWYVYDSTGKPVWYVAPACALSGSSCSGALYRTTGPPFGPTFDSTKITVVNVGSMLVSFIDANNAVISYTVDTVSATKTITRQLF